MSTQHPSQPDLIPALHLQNLQTHFGELRSAAHLRATSTGDTTQAAPYIFPVIRSRAKK